MGGTGPYRQRQVSCKCTRRASMTRTHSGAKHGKRLDWIKPYTKVKNTSYDYDNVSIKWYEDGTLNVCANCVDRHLAKPAPTRWPSSGRATIPDQDETDHLPATPRGGLQICQRDEEERRQKGRPGHHLHAHGAGSGLRHAGLRPARCSPFHRFRRLFRRTLWPAGSPTATRTSSSPPMKAFAAAVRSRSRSTPTRL